MGPSSVQPLLRGDDLSVSYPARRVRDGAARSLHARLTGRRARHLVLDGVSVQLHEDECLAVIGESGSGKTTLTRVLLGLQPSQSGRVTYRGLPVRRGSAGMRALRLESSVVFQDPYASLDPHWTVARSVAEPLDIHGQAADRGQTARRVGETLASVGLDPDTFVHRYPQDLSGGQAQRVTIARAIVARPHVLLADEPMSGVDMPARLQILHALEDIRSRPGAPLALIIVSHDLGMVQHIADTILVLHRGHVVEYGPARQVLGSPHDPYTRRLIVAASW